MERAASTTLEFASSDDGSDSFLTEHPQTTEITTSDETAEIDDAALVLQCLRCSVAKTLLEKRTKKPAVATADIARCSGLTHRQVLDVVQDSTDVAISQKDNRIVVAPTNLFEIPDNSDFCWTPKNPETADAFAVLNRRAFQPSAIFSTNTDVRSALSGYNNDHRLLEKHEEDELSGVIHDPESSLQAVEEAVQTLITHNVRLAYKIAHRSRLDRRFLTFEDAVGSAMMAIGRAAASFDHTKAKFSTYAFAAAENTIQRDAAAGSGIPPSYYQELPRLNVCMNDFEHAHGRLPNSVELSLAANVSVVTILRAKTACDLLTGRVSLDEPLQTGKGKHSKMDLHGAVGNSDTGYDAIEIADSTTKLRNTLSDYGKTVLDCLLILSPTETASDISKQFNTTPAKVKRDIAHIASLLRHPYFGAAVDLPGNEWQEKAACAADQDERVVDDTAWLSDAQALCATCPVAQECYNLATRGQAVTTGVWGGKPAAYFKKYH